MAKKPRLGRGLSSLMSAPVPLEPAEVPAPGSPAPGSSAPGSLAPGSDAPPAPASAADAGPSEGPVIRYVATEHIRPNPHQPRQHFDEAALATLGRSIQQDGLMQPIVLRIANNAPDNTYELVAGERRWRAAKIVGITQLPAIVRDLSDRQLAEWALIENLQREDLDPIEKAHAFQGLIDQFGLSHDDVADRVGVERSTVSNYLRLLGLHDDILAAIRNGRLTMGHARALLGIADAEARLALARRVMAGDWSVRQTEQAVKHLLHAGEDQGSRSRSSGGGGRSAHLADLERQIGSALQTRVAIKPARKKGAGTLAIDFYSLDQFDELMEKLGVKLD